jgi:hypothetical protein
MRGCADAPASSKWHRSAKVGARLGEATLRTPLVVLLAALAFPAAANAAEFAHAKAGVTFLQLKADSDACVQEAKQAAPAVAGPRTCPPPA